MIVIKLTHRKDLSRIEINGHAGFAEKGKDIVCAGVSALFFCLLESLEELSNTVKEIKDIDGYIRLDVINPDYNAVLLIHAAMLGFKKIAEEYPDHVMVNGA